MAIGFLEKAAEYHCSGRLTDAARSAQARLRIDPNSAEGLLRLGVVRAQQGQLETAVSLLRKGLKIDPRSAEGHNNLGLVLHNLGRSEEALVSYQTSISIRPNYATAQNNYGVALFALGRRDKAIASYSSALEIDPNYVEALTNIGVALHAAERIEEAVKHLQKALSVAPNAIEARLNLGHALVSIDRVAEAVSCYQVVLESQPKVASTIVALADALRRVGRSQEATKNYEDACAIAPDFAPAHGGMASVCLENGRIKDAIIHAERALSIDPCRPSYFQTLTRAKKLGPDDLNLTAMLKLAAMPGGLEKGEIIDLYFGLGKALADAGRNDEAFSYVLMGNRMKRETIDYREAAKLRELDRIRSIFTSEFIKKHSGGGHSTSVPIFIVGMPRSGSTLVEQIIASHSNVFGAGEIGAFWGAMAAAGLNGPRPTQADAIRALNSEKIDIVGSDYVTRLLAHVRLDGADPCVARICDKMLDNFRFIGLIHLALPGARIIHTCRDPIETCLSCFSIQFVKLPYTYDLGELGRYYCAYTRLMAHWRKILPEGAILEVQYENVVENFDQEARRIVEFCGLEWDEKCSHFYASDRPVRTASLVQVRQPIYRDSVRRWRPGDDLLRPLLDGLNQISAIA